MPEQTAREHGISATLKVPSSISYRDLPPYEPEHRGSLTLTNETDDTVVISHAGGGATVVPVVDGSSVAGAGILAADLGFELAPGAAETIDASIWILPCTGENELVPGPVEVVATFQVDGTPVSSPALSTTFTDDAD